MKTITITISVPDGVEIRVDGGGSSPQRSSSKPFVERPDPPYPSAPCPVCGNDWKKINAGFSKTKKNDDGTPKRFNAFYVCQTDGCDGKPGQDMVMEDVTSLPF
jgi:hypothetical protein